MDSSVYTSLVNCTLFKGLSKEEISSLIGRHNCTVRRHNRGSIVAFRGDRYADLWIITEGRLRAEFQNHRGKILKVESLAPHEIVASSVLFAPENYLPVTLIAEEDTKICAIRRKDVLELLRCDSRVLINYLEDTGFRLSMLAEKLNMLQFSTIREKIAHYLLDEADKQGTDSPRLSLSKEALSEVFGVTRPSLSREFSHLCDEGTLQQQGAVVHILNRDELLNVIDETQE
ncbi:MAG: Crp/Fnr family transcriptional regulator [Sediminispirochaetaceae bacterium]